MTLFLNKCIIFLSVKYSRILLEDLKIITLFLSPHFSQTLFSTLSIFILKEFVISLLFDSILLSFSSLFSSKFISFFSISIKSSYNFGFFNNKFLLNFSLGFLASLILSLPSFLISSSFLL